MSAVQTDSTAATAARAKATFFRQSGWLIVATVASGACMFGVHFFSKKIPETEYAILSTMLALLNCMTIPTQGLQMVFAQQAAGAVTEEQHRQLTGTTRAVLSGTFLLWLIMAAAMLIGQGEIIARWQIINPAALWVTLLVGLGSLWSPIFGGLLQGQQNFLWMGWGSILGGAGRLVGVTVIVLLLQGRHAAGIMTGALVGMAAAMSAMVWQSRGVWRGPKAPFAWRAWFKRVIPLSLGFGACQFLFSADPLFVKNYFKGDTFYYMAAGTLARALIIFTGPLVSVMFPKIVRSAAVGEKTNVIVVALSATAVMAGLAAFGLSVIAPWLLELVFKETYLGAVPLLPWFALSMVPLSLANVLVNNLLARERFGAVPWLVLLALGYGVALTQFHGSFLTVIRILGLFNLLLLGVAAWFTWKTNADGDRR